MMTKIRQIEWTKAIIPGAMGKRIEMHGYSVIDKATGRTIGHGHSKREAWQQAYAYAKSIESQADKR